MKMTDDNKEIIFNNITKWLRDSNFVISEEKVTVVTSEFYAKAYLQSDHEHILEIMSATGIETRFALRIRLPISEQQLVNYENLEPNEKLIFDDKMNAVIFPQRQSINIKEKSAFLDKTISIDPKSINAKQGVMQNISNLLGSAKKLEIIFDEFLSN
jgi:hypothetical protein